MYIQKLFLQRPHQYCLISSVKLTLLRLVSCSLISCCQSSFCCLRSCQCWTRRAGKTEEKRCFAQWSSYVHVQATKSCKPQTWNDRCEWWNRRTANQYRESSPGVSNADGSSRQKPGYTFTNIQFFKRVRNERKSTNRDQRFTFQKEGSFYEKSSI